MKRFLTILACAMFALSSMAQVKIGFFSYEQALQAMPDYALAQQHVSDLRAQYTAEMERVEKEFNAKYEEFIEGYTSYATSIRQKRQAELKDIMERNISFREEAERLLTAAEADALVPVRANLDAIIQTVGEKFGYIILLNTDSNACPYINPMIGEDANQLILETIAASADNKKRR